MSDMTFKIGNLKDIFSPYKVLSFPTFHHSWSQSCCVLHTSEFENLIKMKVIITIAILVSIITQVFSELDPERLGCMWCLAHGDMSGAHAQMCCYNHGICCPTRSLMEPSNSPGVCDEIKCDQACEFAFKEPDGRCDKEVNFCGCFDKTGKCLNCDKKPAKELKIAL